MLPILIAASDAPASYFLSSAAQTPISVIEHAIEMIVVANARTLNPAISEPSTDLFSNIRATAGRQPSSCRSHMLFRRNSSLHHLGDVGRHKSVGRPDPARG